MNLLYGIVSILIFITIVLVLLYFIYYVEKFTNIPDYIYENVNENILDYSNPLDNQKDMHKYHELFKIDNSFNSIKYIEGVSWDNWKHILPKDNQFQKYSETIENAITDKLRSCNLNAKNIYFKMNKYRNDNVNKKFLIFDIDLVLYKKTNNFAEHIKILCVYNLNTDKVTFINFIIIGIISENNLFMKNIERNGNYKRKNNNFKYDGEVLKTEDNCENIKSHDLQVQKCLYNKIMHNYEISPDLKKNIEYTRDQNLVRKMFIHSMLNNDQSINSNNIFKNYPIKDDFNCE